MSDKMEILVVVGTRPEAIKLVPIILALKESEKFNPIVVSTGQHHKMVTEVFSLAGIVPDYNLWAGVERSSLNERVRSIVGRLNDFCIENFGDGGAAANRDRVFAGSFPAAVLVHGDTTSAFAAALASFHLRIPVVHVEAGLRTNNNLTPFPEELNRQLLSCIACFHLAPTSKNLENLVRENIPVSQIMVTGNTGIDALEWAANLDQKFEDETLEDLCARVDEGKGKFIIVTAHRRENWGSGIEKIIKGLRILAEANRDLTIVIPQHPNEDVRKQWQALQGEENIYLTEPLSYPQFAKLMKHSSFVITDSGGIQEEAPSLNKPVLVVRNKTEREEGIHAGTLKLVGTDPEEIMFYANRLLKDKEFYDEMALAENPYGDGKAAKRIVEALENLSFGGPLPTSFGSIYSPSDVIKAAGYRSEEETDDQPVFDPEQFSHQERAKEDERVVDPIWPSEGSTKEHDLFDIK